MLSRSHRTPWLGLTPNLSSSFASSHILWGLGSTPSWENGTHRFWELWLCSCLCCWSSSAPSQLPPGCCSCLLFVQLFGNAELSSSGIPQASHPETEQFSPEHRALFPPSEPRGWLQKLLQGLPAFPEGCWHFALCKDFMASSGTAIKPSSFFAPFLSPLLFPTSPVFHLSCFPPPMDFGAP